MDTPREARMKLLITIVTFLAAFLSVMLIMSFGRSLFIIENTVIGAMALALSTILAGFFGYQVYDYSRRFYYRILFLNNYVSSVIAGFIVYLCLQLTMLSFFIMT
jgi:hypothetical protein